MHNVTDTPQNEEDATVLVELLDSKDCHHQFPGEDNCGDPS